MASNNKNTNANATFYIPNYTSNTLTTSYTNNTSSIISAISDDNRIICESDDAPEKVIQRLSHFIGNSPEISETAIRSLLNDRFFYSSFHILVDQTKNNKSIYINSINDLFVSILQSNNISENFIKDYEAYMNMHLILSNYFNLSISFLESHINDYNETDWNLIALYQKNLTENFLYKYADHLNMAIVSKNKYITLSNRFLIKFKNKIDINALIDSELYDIHFIIKNFSNNKQLDWSLISWRYDLTENEIFEHIDNIDFNSSRLSNRTFENNVITMFRKLKFNL